LKQGNAAGIAGIVDRVSNIVKPLADYLAYDLVDVEFVKESGEWYLRAYIDKVGGITIDDCERLSTLLSDKLDEGDPIQQAYILEVSSPGIDRPLKTQSDFDRYEGALVEVHLRCDNTEGDIPDEPGRGKKRAAGRRPGAKGGNQNIVEGRLGKLENGVLSLSDKKEKPIQVDMDKVIMVKRAFKF